MRECLYIEFSFKLLCATSKGGGTISINIPALQMGAVLDGGIMEKDFQKLYSDNYLKLVRQATFLIGDVSAAEDLAQEAFIRLHRTNLTSVENPPAWLTKVINNLCYDYMRSEGSRRKREEKYFQPVNQEALSSTSSAENLVMDMEEIRLVQQALLKLQPRDRLVLLMRFSGYGYDEIAATTEMNKGSVGTVLARARERFKRAYQKIL